MKTILTEDEAEGIRGQGEGGIVAHAITVHRAATSNSIGDDNSAADAGLHIRQPIKNVEGRRDRDWVINSRE